MTSVRKKWQVLVAVAGILMAVMFSVPVATAQGKTVQRPIQDFLDTQGSFCVDDSAGGCLLFVPPDPNFLGWNSEFDATPVRFAGVDYAGLALDDTYALGKEPQITGTVTERPLKDGSAEVTVRLHTQNANVWVIELDASNECATCLEQIASKPTLFGHRPAEVRTGASQALGDSFLHVVFINSAPGAPLPDLIAIMNTPAIKFVAFHARAHGPLTAEFGVADGTPGRCTITQTGLFKTKGQGVALEDSFPAEAINLSVVGR